MGQPALVKSSSSKKQDEEKEDETFSSRSTSASSTGPDHSLTHLFSAVATADVQAWKEGRFTYVRKLCDAPRNQGAVQLMRDQSNNDLVAVKQMPNTWVRTCHKDFTETHPKEAEFPWLDIGCTQFLNSVNFKYACNLLGVFRSYEHTFVAMEFASEGDLYGVAFDATARGLEREAKYSQLAFQLLSGVKHLHNLQISHGDLSLENVLVTKTGSKRLEVKIIDYSMASTNRIFQGGSYLRGKPSYQAPEMHARAAYDSFLAESFSVGVILYTLFVKELPWLSTKPGSCRIFELTRANGFRAVNKARKLRGTDDRVSDVLSEPLTELLEGMLAHDPKTRLTLGEHEFSGRRSVWEESWVHLVDFGFTHICSTQPTQAWAASGSRPLKADQGL